MIYPDRLPSDAWFLPSCDHPDHRNLNYCPLTPEQRIERGDKPANKLFQKIRKDQASGTGEVTAIMVSRRTEPDPRTNLKLKPAYSAKLEALMPAYRARSKAHLLEMLIDDAALRVAAPE